jgi:signal transduction histidine kinase
MKRHEQRLFKLYSRLHNSSVPGKGIGLYLIKSHVESMGGYLELKSTPGAGSEFKIYIPDK